MKTLIQMYPGQFLPALPDDDAIFPHPKYVGQFCTKEIFIKSPKWQATWVHWHDRCEHILNGEYNKIIPVHFEGIFTLTCSFMCPHCTRKVDRKSNGAWGNFTGKLEDIRKVQGPHNTMDIDLMKHVIDELSKNIVDGQMGIVWGGGDPTVNVNTYEGISYAKSKGIKSSLITNGVFLDIEKVIKAEPTLIRISLNCHNSKIYNAFHGLKPEWNYHTMAMKNIEELNRILAKKKSDMLFGLSLIIDERNLPDFEATVKYIYDLVVRDGKGIDYIIVRPVMKYDTLENSDVALADDTKSKAEALFSENTNIRSMLDEINIPIVPIKDSFLPPPDDEYYVNKDECLAYGMCGEIRFNGDVQLCSDTYGNPEYTIGNLKEQSLQEIFSGKRRQAVINRVREKKCFRTKCPYNSRGHHLNRMFYQVEDLRRKGEIDKAALWISLMRKYTYPMGHSFFI